VPTVIKLRKQVGVRTSDRGYSESGSLKARVAPGSYVASAYVGDRKLAEDSFDIAANENKRILLTVRTVYIEGFGVVPNHSTENGELAFAQIVYTINNLYQSFPQAKVVLKVERDGTPVDEIAVAALAPLEKGTLGLNYRYVPAEGWSRANYRFRLELDIAGQVYTVSQEETLLVDAAAPEDREADRLLIGAIAGGTALVALIALMLFRRWARA